MLKFLLTIIALSVLFVLGAILYFVWWVRNTKQRFDRLAQGQQAQQRQANRKSAYQQQSKQQSNKGKKIFAEDEGEYIDFEEEK